jgi:predicted nucleic acid-binding protein
MTSHLLDSNVLILALRSRPAVLDWLDAVGSHDLHGISVVTRTEILAVMRPYEEDRTMDLVESFISFPVTPDIADRAGR